MATGYRIPRIQDTRYWIQDTGFCNQILNIEVNHALAGTDLIYFPVSRILYPVS